MFKHIQVFNTLKKASTIFRLQRFVSPNFTKSFSLWVFAKHMPAEATSACVLYSVCRSVNQLDTIELIKTVCLFHGNLKLEFSTRRVAFGMAQAIWLNCLIPISSFQLKSNWFHPIDTFQLLNSHHIPAVMSVIDFHWELLSHLINSNWSQSNLFTPKWSTCSISKWPFESIWNYWNYSKTIWNHLKPFKNYLQSSIG